MNLAFLDTGYLIALELSKDQNHSMALKHWRGMTRSLPKLVTTSYVFDEVVTFFNSRGHHAKAIELGNRLLNSSAVQLVQVDEELFYEGWRYFQKHKDKSYSLTDSISFVLMKGMKIETALTFDNHFTQAGFKKLP
ncbi:MAG TPA: PIN domain-containing protein [Pyrinomonadaceae bacterium]|jgi:predicted nucleic acid-binding protein